MQPNSNIRKPRVSDKALWDIISGMIGYPAVFVAHDLKLFELLAKQPLTLAEVAAALHIEKRPLEAILTANLALNLLQYEDYKYALTILAEDYLLEESPTYFGYCLDLVITNKFAVSIESLKQAVLSNSPQTYGGDDVFKSHEELMDHAQAFTRMMHSMSMAPALTWPDALDLSEHRCLLDVGGGSGAHTIGALQRWPQLSGVIFDIAPVCQVAEEFISQHKFGDRIRTCVGDLWESPYPLADIHFYSQIYHDWSLEKCQLLTQKSFDSLPPGGRIIIHEMLYDDDKMGPFITAAASVAMLLWTEGKQFSGQELTKLLAHTGFTDIVVKPSFGYWSIVSGRKK